MAESNEQQERNEEESSQSRGGGAGGTALKAAAAAAATGAAAYAARKALTHERGSSNGHNGGSSSRSSQGSGMVGSIFSGSWEAARDQLVPLAEDAAGVAGKYLAEHGPDFLRDRLVPRFISSFEDARD